MKPGFIYRFRHAFGATRVRGDQSIGEPLPADAATALEMAR
jgi:hypothetical protein